ncbi:cation:proton antiporter [Frisingicoccus sp.]|uniref:cation:proton antiporter n=1 Tax=Frisingicoccus sp. TaxID=1918627 RepID=UPI003026045E
MTTILAISVALIMGLLMTRILRPLKLPDVTAYLIAGVLIGPYVLGRLNIQGVGFISTSDVEQYALISSVALGFIAFTIGNEFRLSQLKNIGRQAMVVGIAEGLVASVCVNIAMFVLHIFLGDKLPVTTAILLGAIATATAPAATLMVVRQYKAKGKLTDILLPVVALDDAVALMVFAVSFGVAMALRDGAFNITSILVEPILEIILSLIVGAFMGWLLTQLETLFNSNSNRLSLTIAFVFLTVGISMLEFDIGGIHIAFSSLLVCMMLGTIFCNICPLSEDLMEKSDRWTAPLFALFFVISGAELELSVFSDISIVIIGVVYIVFRCIGKYLGAWSSSKAAGCDPTVQKYLGITLFPQAGVALGMCITAAAKFGAEGAMIRNIILFSVLVYELVGPSMTKWALKRTGDIQPKSAEVINRRAMKLQEAEVKKKAVK